MSIVWISPFTGAMNTLITQAVMDQATYDKWSLLFVWYKLLTQVLWTVGVWGVSPKAPYWAWLTPKIALLSLLDLLSFSLGLIGQSYLGSAVFALVGASGLALNAIFSRVLFNRRLSSQRWVAIVIISCGLGITSQSSGGANGSVPLVGLLFCVASVVTKSVQAVLTEQIKPSPSTLIDGVAIWGFLFVSLYVVVWVGPRWDVLVEQKLQKAVASHGWSAILNTHAALALINLAHNWIYWNIAVSSGSVINAICKACQGVLVVALSQFLFCDATHPLQCIDRFKVLGGLFILAGTAWYNLSPK